MSQAASQAAAFYRDAVENDAVWTIRDEGGFPAPMNRDGRRAQPFWSSRPRAERIIKTLEAYKGFEPVEVRLQDFLETWIPRLAGDDVLVGVNWSGSRATGYDVEPDAARESINWARRTRRKATNPK
jgi:hypothetical protein